MGGGGGAIIGILQYIKIKIPKLNIEKNNTYTRYFLKVRKSIKSYKKHTSALFCLYTGTFKTLISPISFYKATLPLQKESVISLMEYFFSENYFASDNFCSVGPLFFGQIKGKIARIRSCKNLMLHGNAWFSLAT